MSKLTLQDNPQIIGNFITVKEATKLMGLSRIHVATLARRGKLKSRFVGNLLVLDKESVVNYRPGKVGRKIKQPQPVVAAPIKCGESTTDASQKQAESEVSHEQ